MKKLMLCIFLIILFITGCSGSNNVVNESDDFGLLEYMPENENYMISPLSIKMAMMMAANGADGETRQEILNAFEVDDIDKYNDFAKNIIKKYSENDMVQMNIANSVWLNESSEKNFDFNPNYKNLVKKYFDGTVGKVNHNNAIETINNWCSEKTNGKINEIINRNDFSAILINALYFKGDWEDKFNEYNTKEDKFTMYDGNLVDKEFMNKTDKFNYYEDKKMKMVELPYKDGKTSMYVILPKGDKKLDIENAINNMENVKVKIKLPKFKVEYNKDFVEILRLLGINKAFSPDFAEFNDKMFVNSINNNYIDKVFQKTYIEVDEEGTEAAAVTSVMTYFNSIDIQEPEEIKEFIADEPFTYFIRDNESSTILFMGKIVK